jgi:predicted AAA+ superfamily ATPase
MNVAEIRRVIQEQEEERKKLMTTERIIEREGGREKALNAIRFPNILAILGVRRCGKSVFSWLLLGDRKYGYINFDDEALYGITAKDLNVVLKTFYELYGTDLEFIVLDEIQNVDGWELFANRLRRSKRVIITGSNSKLLSGELATHLTGRHIDFLLFPFSFREFLAYNGISQNELKDSYLTESSATAERMLRDYIVKGGFPEVYKLGDEILKSIFGDIVKKDVIRRYNIKNVRVMEVLARYLVSNFSNEITFNKLKNIFEIRKISTIKNYISYLQDAYLIYIIERFSPKLKQQIIAPKKVYCIDTGIINRISPGSSEKLGKMMENIVLIELLRRKSYWYEDMEVYYWKDYQQHEVDFVVIGREDQLIQVCYNIEEFNTREREIRSLLKASREIACKKLLVITWDYEDEIEVENRRIEFIPLWRWLLRVP